MTEEGAPRFSVLWVWLFPPVYLIHLLDERFFGEGTAAWATRHMGVYLTNDAWLVINVAWFLLLIVAVSLVAHSTWPDWVVIAMATHLAIHSLTRLWGSAVFPGWSPGVLSGVVVCMPLVIATFLQGLKSLTRREIVTGCVVGVLSLQPLWDFIMLPVLSPKPLGF